MRTEARHTPGTVEVHNLYDLVATGGSSVVIAEALGTGSLAQGNADRLALCWNLHDELVEALDLAYCSGDDRDIGAVIKIEAVLLKLAKVKP